MEIKIMETHFPSVADTQPTSPRHQARAVNIDNKRKIVEERVSAVISGQ